MNFNQYNDNKYYDSWESALEVIKQHAPEGLYKQWEELTPIGLLQWSEGMEVLKDVDNSFNWVDNDKDYRNIIFQCGSLGDLTAVAFHKEGDARGNYTDYFLFKECREDMTLLYPIDDEEWLSLGGEIYE